MRKVPCRLYDLFSPDTYEYPGTVEAPLHVTFFDGTGGLVAGVVRGPLDTRAVGVWRVSLER